MSANTSRVIWKGESSQKSLARPGLTFKAGDLSLQKMESIHGATKSIKVDTVSIKSIKVDTVLLHFYLLPPSGKPLPITGPYPAATA